MNRITLIFIGCIFFLGQITAQLTTITRNLDNFAGLSVGGDIKVELIPSTQYKAEIKMIRGEESDLVSEVKAGTLNLKIKNKSFWGRNKTKAEITLYYVSLEEVDASAGCSIRALQPIKARSLQLEASSGSHANLNIEVQKIMGGASSGATLTITGKAQDVVLEASSGATVDADGMECASASVDVSSGAHLEIWATKKLTADASSGGSITYKGEPEELNKKGVSSGGSVRKK